MCGCILMAGALAGPTERDTGFRVGGQRVTQQTTGKAGGFMMGVMIFCVAALASKCGL